MVYINVGRVTVDLAAADPENEAITMAMEQVFIKTKEVLKQY